MQENSPHEALFYERLPAGEVRCGVCLRRCRLAQGRKGFCLTRKNVGGTLASLIYGAVSTLHYSPAEKKPLFHFFPGEIFLSIGSLGCNFRCPGCQNWKIAHLDAETNLGQTQFISPERLVELAVLQKAVGISWTYNEPTLWFEYSLDVARLARAHGLLTNYVTNGSITPEALDAIGPYLDAFRVDIKGYWPRTYERIANFKDVHSILTVVERAKKKWAVHVECVTNVIPGMNDDAGEIRAIARWIRDYLGPETPWHITRFYPAGKLNGLPPTSISLLESLSALARDEGLLYVYLGNVPGHPEENTLCANCGGLLIEREGFSILKNAIQEGKCPWCSHAVPGKFR